MIGIGSSETLRKTTFDFSEYKQNIVPHKTNIDIHFLEWFIGFIEGDGSFIVSNDRLFFIIHQKEEKLLRYIRTNLGFGKVSKYKTHSRFIVADKCNVDRLICLFNGNLILDKTNTRFLYWLHARNAYSINKLSCFRFTPYQKNPQEQLFKQESAHHSTECEHTTNRSTYSVQANLISTYLSESAWLSGFIDAEGCFNVVRSAAARYSLGYRVRLRFIIDQKNELTILEQIRALLGSGVITQRKSVDGLYRFTSTNISSHEKLVKYLTRYPLRSIKKVSYMRFLSLLGYIRNRSSLPWQGKVLKRVENLISGITKRTNSL